MSTKKYFALLILALLPFLFISRDAQADPQSSIRLAYATFDPIIEGEPAISRTMRAPSDSNYRILQLLDAPNSATIAELRGLGIEFLDIIPTNGYIVRLDGTSRGVLANHPAVRWVGDLHPVYKISTHATEGEMKVMLFPDSDVDEVARAAEAAGGTVTHKEDNEFGQQLVVEISAENLPALAAIDQVRWVQNTVDYFFVNDSARSVVQSGNFGERLKLYENGLTGEGHVTALADSGIDAGFDAVANQPLAEDGSCYFAEEDGEGVYLPYGATHRKIVGYNGAITPGGSDGQDENGHGTHVAGSIAGDQPPYGVLSPNDGQAYAARLYFHDINDDGSNSVFVPPDLRVMYADAYDTNKNGTFELDADARIHSNSWGSLLTVYEGNAFETDDYLWNNPDMLILFAGGNQGPAPTTIGTPGVAKNLVTVGATENGSGANNQAEYSSHGPVLPNGRLKPDVSAPGSGMVSALYNDDCGTQSLSGTSMATPTTNGIATLMRQYLYEGYYPHGHVGSGATVEPSGMLLKSMLINSGRRMTGLFSDNLGGVTGAWPSNGQGWGRIAADDVLYFPGDGRDLWFADVYSLDGSVGLDDAENSAMSYTLSVMDNEPLKISLVWYDSATSPLVGLAGEGTLNNELDLTVEVNGTTYAGNGLTSDFTPNNELNAALGETTNNTEVVYIEEPEAGEYTITVEMTQMSSTDGRMQPFALVATGKFLTSTGRASIVADAYDPTPSVSALLRVRDADLDTSAGLDSVTVTVTSTTQTTPVNVVLTETGAETAIFEGSVVLYSPDDNDVATGDVEVAEGDIVRLTYDDQNDELGNFHQAFDTAIIRGSLLTNLNPPELSDSDNADGNGNYTLDWSAAETNNPWDDVTKEIASYVIEESTDYQQTFSDDGQSTANWTVGGSAFPGFNWRSELYPGAPSLTNVLRGGNVGYSAFNTDTVLTQDTAFSVPDLGEASLTFFGRFFSDPDDYGYVEVSTDEGENWEEVYRVTRSPQVAPLDIRMEHTTIDLNDYRGQDIQLRLTYGSGGLIYYLYPATEGWRVDDLSAQAGTWGIADPVPVGGGSGSITSDTTYDVENRANGTYFYRVRAIYADGTASGWSNVIEVEVSDGAIDPVTVSINDVTVAEGDGSATLTVSLSEAATEDVSFDYATIEGGSATGGDDFVTASDTVTITAGNTSADIIITILEDNLDENDEAFGVQLSNVSANAEIADGTGVVTITDNDEATLSIADVTAAEDVAGGAMVTVTLSAEATFPITATYTTQDGTASSSDYTAATDTIEFAAGETEKTIPIALTVDAVDENDETFNVILTDAAVTITDDTAVVTIVDVNDAPTLSVADVTVDEGVGTATITVTLSGGTELTPTVQYATADDSALDGSDYDAASGTLTFDNSDTETFTVNIIDDMDDENTELFTVNLSSPTDATIDDGSADIRINDNDVGNYELTIGDVTVDEAAGTATVDVTLSPAANNGATVDYTTSDGTATVDEDYTAASGTLTFANGEDTQQIVVTIANDDLDEIDETILVTLSNAGGADAPTIADDQATITITDNDDPPALSVEAGEANEGGTVAITVTLDAPSGQVVTVNYGTTDGTATDGSDYTGVSGTLTFQPGETTKTFTINISADALDEDDETFTVSLSDETNATVGTGSVEVTIVDANDMPAISIADLTVSEGVGEAAVEVTLDAASGRAVTVNYATSDGTAVAGEDYSSAMGTATFAAGETTAVISVTISADTLDEANETFDITLSTPVNAMLANESATVTINDDDAPPSISINDVSASEPDGTITFTVSLDAVSSLPVSVDYATSDNSALATEDYTADNGTVMFAAGETSAEIAITLTSDTRNEDTERFFVMLSNPSNGAIGDNQGEGTITDDDPEPTITIADAMVSEGDGTAIVTVTLSAESSFDVTVDYETADAARAGATGGEDYTVVSGTLTIPAGQTTGSVSVAIIDDDTSNEGDETFSVDFSNPTRTSIVGNSSATVTISDNEIPTAVGLQRQTSTAVATWWLPLLMMAVVLSTLVSVRWANRQ